MRLIPDKSLTPVKHLLGEKSGFITEATFYMNWTPFPVFGTNLV